MGSQPASQDIEPRFHLEAYEAPGSLRHGDSAELRLVGWLASEPQVREVTLKLSDDEEIVASCDVARPDVIASYPDFTNELCGFDIKVDLSFLEPGLYQAEWLAPAVSLAAPLGNIHVLPRCRFEATRIFVPDAVNLFRPFPVSLEGTLESSCVLHRLEVRWNSQETSIQPDFVEGEQDSNGLRRYHVSFFDQVTLSGSRPRYNLELIFYTRDGELHRWKHRGVFQIADVPSHSVSLKAIGAYDPSTERVPIHIKGTVNSSVDDFELVLTRGEEELLAEPLANFPTRHSLVWFELARELTSIPPGTWDFGLALRQGDSPLLKLAAWRHQVKMIEPRVFVEHFDIRSAEIGQPGYTVGLVGWVDHHFALDELVLKIGEIEEELSLDQLRPDVAEHLGQNLVRRQGIHTDLYLDIPPGDYPAQILFTQSGVQHVAWEKSVSFEERTSPKFLVSSEQLADFADGKHCGFWSSILIEGEVASRVDGMSADLWVDGEKADQSSIGFDRLFTLSHVPEVAGCYQVRMKLSAPDQILFDSGDHYVSFENFDLPEHASSSVRRFIRRFGLDAFFQNMEAHEILRELFRSDRGLMSDYLEMLGDVDEALSLSERLDENQKIPTPIKLADERRDRRLKVLFVSWEIPYPRHGGGVWLTQLIKHLATRHEITLIHSYGLDEQKWVDEVQEYVPRVISVPRAAKAKSCPPHNRALSVLYDDYLPDLETAIQLEAEVGNYDIVNYDYVKLYPHATTIDIPRTMIVHEERLAARLANGPESDSQAHRVKHLDALLKDFYFSTVALPGRFPHLVALTEEDATTLSEYQETATVQVNHIGADTGGLARPQEVSAGQAESPTLVFLGNYKHPPNVAAVKFFADKVMPEVRSRCPQAQFLIVGANSPPELEDRESENIVTTGFVDDFRPYIWNASAFVAPIFTGAGMRVKVLEAMACGAPIVGSRLSMHGIEAIDGQHYLHAETASEFAEAACRCVEEPELALRIGRQGADLMVRKYSYEISAREREEIWYQVIDNWRR